MSTQITTEILSQLVPIEQSPNDYSLTRQPPTWVTTGDAIPTADYVWFSDVNRKAVLNLLQGAQVAMRHQWQNQIVQYQEAVIELFNKDRAEHTQWQIAHNTHYSGRCFRHFKPADFDKARFTIQDSGWNTRFNWVYQRIEDFNRLIPPHALRALAVLDEAKIKPQQYWVADKVEMYHTRIIDPILYAQFGFWLVAIAEWA